VIFCLSYVPKKRKEEKCTEPQDVFHTRPSFSQLWCRRKNEEIGKYEPFAIEIRQPKAGNHS
jgi:hypothetical protein